jgi:hypothetical protein
VTAKAPEKAEDAPLSALCVVPPPEVVDDQEHYVRLGPRGARRPVQRGDHLPPDHELVAKFPANFRPSGERVDVVVITTLSEAVRAAQEAERLRLLARHAEVRRWTCENCGEQSEESPPIPPPVAAVTVASALDDAPDLAARREIQLRSYMEQSRRLAALAEADRIAAEFQHTHVSCDPSRSLTPPEPLPEQEPGSVWSGPVSTRAPR